MFDFIKKILEADYKPLNNGKDVLNEVFWLQTISGMIIAVSFFVLAFLLLFIAVKRKEVNYKTIVILSGLFLFTSGSYHLLDIISIWTSSVYFVDELFKVAAAVLTIFVTFKLMQSFWVILSIPTRKEWEQLNVELKKQIEQLKEKDKTIEKIKEFEFLANSIPQIIWTSKPDGNLDYYNEHWYKFTGLTFDQTKDWGWQPVLHPDDLQNCINAWNESVKTGKLYQVEYRFKKAEDGQYRWHLGRGIPMKDEHGNIIKWFGTCTDIHDYKLLEEELIIKNTQLQQFNNQAILEVHKNSQALNGILQGMPVILYKLDRHGIITESKGSGLKGVGLKNHEIIGKNAFREYPNLKNTLEKMLLVEEMNVFITSEIYDGKVCHLENYVFPDKLKNDGSIVVFALDITDKKMAENKLKESEEKFQAIFDNTFQFIGLMEPDGKLIEVNKRALDFGGLDPNKIKGKHFWDVPKIARDDEGKENFKRAITEAANGKFVRLEANMSGIKGQFICIDFSIKPVFDNEGNVKWLIPEGRDITQIKMVEEELKKEKINAVLANQSKSRFLASMSHEIRTPLNAILGFTDVLLKDDISKEQKNEYLAHISASGNILLKLIGDILDISKIEEGKLTLSNELFNLKEVINSGIYPYKFKANEKGLDLDINFGENLPEYVIGDPNRITQIIINLIGNALKFTKQGKISILVKNLIIPEENKTNALIEISITDTGIGIAKEKHATIFESFIQADNSIAKLYGGSGLGLSIVKQLVTMMGGEINLKSPVYEDINGNSGTTFTFTLPFTVTTDKKDYEDQIMETEEIVPFSPKLKVLIAEDNLINQKLARIVLTRLGCETDHANHGQEAIEMLVQKDYDVVLMDFQMPVMDGFEATVIIRNDLKSMIPIIGLSANVFQDDLEKALNAGMNDNLGKPYGERQLYKILKKWVLSNYITKQINLNYLMEVCHEDHQTIADFIIMILEQNEKFFIGMEKHLKTLNYKNMNAEAHRLKSSAKMVEAGVLRNLLVTLEKLTDEKAPIADIMNIYNMIKLASDKIVDALKQELVTLKSMLAESK